MDDNGRPLTAREKRQEQLKRWENSATDLECPTYKNPKVKVKFNDGAVFLAACSSGDISEIKQLLANGADIDFANVDGLTALHEACIDGNLDVVEFLVENGADIDKEDNEGWSPLHATSSCGFIDIAKYLVRKGANVASVNTEGEVPLDIAEDSDMADYLEAEVKKQNIDINEARNREHQVMLHDANQQLEAYLKGEKHESYRHTNSGASALHIAAAKGYHDVLDILLKAGVSTNVVDNDGWTPLHAASHWAQEDAAKILSDKGGDLNIRSKLGQTPFDVADEEMLEFLEELRESQSLKTPAKDLSDVIGVPPIKAARTTIDDKKITENGNAKKPSLKVADKNKYNEETEAKNEKNKIQDENFRYSKKFTKSSENEAMNEEGGIEINFDKPVSPRPQSLVIDQRNASPKPVAATQPVQSVRATDRRNRENGDITPPTPSAGQNSVLNKSKKIDERKKESTEAPAPGSWRSGLRKTGSFDEKPKTLGFVGIGRSESDTLFNAKNNEARTARVAPMTDKIIEDNENSSLAQRFGRRRTGSDAPSTPGANVEDRTFKRSSTSEVPKEEENEKTEEVSESKDRRRSHLQPVRDEEAEAKRRQRSRHQRQTRRSTQGVTLDVVEEAMRQIGVMKEKKKEKEETSNLTADADASTAPGRIPHNDSAMLYPRVHAHGHGGGSSLPSGYVPRDQRVKQSASANAINTAAVTASSNTGVVIPTISVSDSTEKSTPKDPNLLIAEAAANATSAQRKTNQQQRRRERKNRRSTGLPDLAPEPTQENNKSDEEVDTIKDDSTEKAERLRSTAEKYNSSSLPDRSNRHKNALSVDNDTITSRLSSSDRLSRNNEDTKDYKSLFEDTRLENERLQSKMDEMKKKMSDLQKRLDLVDESNLQSQLDAEKREKRSLERKLTDFEKNAQNVEEITKENKQLKNENKALVRIVEKLGGPVSLLTRDTKSNVRDVEESDSSENSPLPEEFIARVNEKVLKKDSLSEGLDSKRSSISSTASGDDKFLRTSSLRSKRDSDTSDYSTRSRERSRDRPTDTYVPRSTRLESSYSNPSIYSSNRSSYSSSRPYSSSLYDKPPSGTYRSLPASSPVVSRTSPRNSITSLRSQTPAHTTASSTRNYSSASYASPTPRKKYSSSKPSSLTSKLTSSLSSFSASKRPVKY